MSRARELADLSNVINKGANLQPNLIINSDMSLAQRGTSAVTATANFPVDRFRMDHSSDGAFSAQQSSVVPSSADFKNSLKVQTTTADSSLAATQFLYMRQIIEGQNITHLLLGSSLAKKITLSFWVRSSLTGTFGGSFWNDGFNRSHPYTYTINAADTWEKKTITITGDTSGTWLTTNGRGLNVAWGLGVGSTYSGTAGAWAGSGLVSTTGATSLLGTLNATWYVTGVTLTVGDTAPVTHPYESFGENLKRCQRYFTKSGSIGTAEEWYAGVATYSAFGARNAINLKSTNDRAWVTEQWPVHMRAIPTLTFYPARSALSQTAGSISQYNANTAVTTSTKPLASTQNLYNYFLGTSSDNTSGYTYQYYADAEL
tara:strand:+ start:446 stop:1564 length:1119 start_codon:yes stop_codon:yes gene_type:complete